MIAHAKPTSASEAVPAWHEPFLTMLPAIERHARIAFRHFQAEARADSVQEVVANAMVAYVRLVESGRTALAYATPLAMYGVRQVKAGRRVGNKLNVRDVTSLHCQRAKGIRVGRLDHRNRNTSQWEEVLIEDRRAGPADTAAARIDFDEWLGRLSSRRRRIAELLATEESTKVVATRFRVSSGRVSQIRRELEDSWREFQHEARRAVAVA